MFKNTCFVILGEGGRCAFMRLGGLLLLALGLAGTFLGQQHGVDVGKHATGSDGDATQQLAELLVVSDGQLNVAGHHAGLLVVTGGIAGQLQHLGGQVLEHGSQVDGGAGAHALGIATLLQVAGDAAHGELQASLGAVGDGLLAGSLALATSSSCVCLLA